MTSQTILTEKQVRMVHSWAIKRSLNASKPLRFIAKCKIPGWDGDERTTGAAQTASSEVEGTKTNPAHEKIKKKRWWRRAEGGVRVWMSVENFRGLTDQWQQYDPSSAPVWFNPSALWESGWNCLILVNNNNNNNPLASFQTDVSKGFYILCLGNSVAASESKSMDSNDT